MLMHFSFLSNTYLQRFPYYYLSLSKYSIRFIYNALLISIYWFKRQSVSQSLITLAHV